MCNLIIFVIVIVIVILVHITCVLEFISTSCFDRPPPILILDIGSVAGQAKGGRYKEEEEEEEEVRKLCHLNSQFSILTDAWSLMIDHWWWRPAPIAASDLNIHHCPAFLNPIWNKHLKSFCCFLFLDTSFFNVRVFFLPVSRHFPYCLLYTSDAADE